MQSSFPSQPRTQYRVLFTWSVPELTFHNKLTKCWHLISITLCHAAFENYFSRTEFQLVSKVKGINKYLYHLVHLHYLTVDKSSPSLSASTMGICALKNNTFDGPNYLVTQTQTDNSIHFGQRIISHWPVINSNALASFLYKSQCFILFGLVSNSPLGFLFVCLFLHLCWLLFPNSSTCFQVLATWIYSFQWILHSWVGLQVAVNVLHRWLPKSWFISSGGDIISP